MAYIAVSVLVAARKPFWEDEFFTLYLSSLSPHETWTALLTGADQHPPLFYWLTHACLSIFGVNHVSARLPAIAGVAVLCVCLYRIASRRTSSAYGLVALLAALVTAAQRYAIEARGYGWALGMAALAVLCWLEAADGRRRGLALAGLAAALALAVSGHYYAVLALAPLAVGEAMRTATRRRIDFPMWAAFCAPVVPLALYAPVIRAARGYSATFWGAPNKWDLLESSHFLFAPAIVPVVGILLFAAVYAMRGAPRESSTKIPGYELAAAATLLALPLAAMALAVTVTNGFAHRYVLYPVIGFSMLFATGAHFFFRGRTAPALAVAGILFGSFFVGALYDYRVQSRERGNLGADIQYLREHADGDLPIAIMDGSAFYRMSFYAPRKLANRFVYLADPAAANRYIGHDTIERGLLDLAPWFPLRPERYRHFLASRPSFLAYGPVTWMGWQLWGFVNDRTSAELAGRNGISLMFRVRSGASEAAASEDAASRPLREAQAIAPDRSLCDALTGDRLCRIFY